MSEQAPESSGGSLDSAFSKRYGPLTGLQWTGVAVAGAGLYIWYRNKHAASTGSSSSSGQATAYGYTGMPYDYGPSIAAQQSEIQALQAGQSTSTPASSSTGTSTARTPVIGPTQPFRSSPGKTPETTVYNSSGGNAGPYYTGQAQLSFLQQNVGKYGLTNSEVSDVQNAYNQAVSMYGQAGANQFHYAWYGPGNVQLQNPSRLG